MSYDLLVFDPKVAPRGKADFMNWYEAQTEWEEEHSYDDPAVSSEPLRNWFLEMIKTFPALNGPYAAEDADEDYVTDYSLGQDVIYAGFRWPKAEQAYTSMFDLAQKHMVGFFDTSDSGDIFFPNEQGNLEPIGKTDKKPWWKLW